MSRIDPTARVSPEAVIGEEVEIGAYSIVESGVSIGAGTRVGPHCLIQGPTVIGPGCVLTGYASIGTPPQDHSYRGEDTRLEIGANNTIREFVTINRGTLKEWGVTTVGSHNLIMAYCHVGHDCTVGSHIVMGNGATLAGHVQIHDHAIIGGLTAIHQFTRVGARAIVGGGSMVSLDIIPYAKASGDRARLFGVNAIGLRRAGFTAEQIRTIDKAYRILLKNKLLLKDALEALEREFLGDEIVNVLVDFLKTSKRGIAR
ncbi:MAG: acyl-ACP--UDP-N-acetylglucosamine O-acyltransferase [Desulfomonilia bacterium]